MSNLRSKAAFSGEFLQRSVDVFSPFVHDKTTKNIDENVGFRSSSFKNVYRSESSPFLVWREGGGGVHSIDLCINGVQI